MALPVSFIIHPLNNPDLAIGHPFGEQRKTHTHKGVDLYAESGSNVHSVYDGVVVKSGDNIDPDGFGGVIVIKHDTPMGTVYSTYGHVKARFVQEGDEVEAGDIIALSGGASTDPHRGNSMGAHLHFELGKEIFSKQFDPAPYLKISQKTDKSGLNPFQRLWKGLELGKYSTKDVDEYLSKNKASKSVLEKFYNFIGENPVGRLSKALTRLGKVIYDKLLTFEETEKYDIDDRGVVDGYFKLSSGNVLSPMRGISVPPNQGCNNGFAIKHTVYNTQKKETQYFTTQFCDLKTVKTITGPIDKSTVIGTSDGNAKAYIYANGEHVRQPQPYEKEFNLGDESDTKQSSTQKQSDDFVRDALNKTFKPAADALSGKMNKLLDTTVTEDIKRMKDLIKY